LTDRIRRRALVAGTTVLAFTTVVAGTMTPGYDPMADTISRLASPGAPLALAVRASFVLYGLSVVVWSQSIRLARRLVAWYGIAGVIAGLAPKSMPDTAPSLASQVHVLATVTGGGALVLAMVVVARGTASRVDAAGSTVCAVATAVGALVFALTWGTAVYGAVERCLVVAAAGWLLVVTPRVCASKEPWVGGQRWRERRSS